MSATDYLNQVTPVLSKGLEELCRRKPEKPLLWLAGYLMRNNPQKAIVTEPEVAEQHFRRLNVILIGPPACGKGTQSAHLINECHVKQYSTGDMLRAVVASGSELGVQLKDMMSRGELVPDETIIDLLKENLVKSTERTPKDSPGGFLLDGFPRTLVQAKKLEELFEEIGIVQSKGELVLVFHFDIDDEILVERGCGRRLHVPSGRIYHIKYNPPKVEGKDDITGEDLIQRSDDTEAVVRSRIATYHQMTAPIIEFYRKKGLVFTVDASKHPDEVWSHIRKVISTMFVQSNN